MAKYKKFLKKHADIGDFQRIGICDVCAKFRIHEDQDNYYIDCPACKKNFCDKCDKYIGELSDGFYDFLETVPQKIIVADKLLGHDYLCECCRNKVYRKYKYKV